MIEWCYCYHTLLLAIVYRRSVVVPLPLLAVLNTP